MASFADTAPRILTDIEAARSLIRELDRAGDLLEAACSAAVLVNARARRALGTGRQGQHALALLETAQSLHARLAQLLEVWKTVERS